MGGPSQPFAKERAAAAQLSSKRASVKQFVYVGPTVSFLVRSLLLISSAL